MQRFGGRYRCGEVVGRGAMGVVHRAVDETTGRTVAIKLLHRLAGDPLVRFRREVRLLSQLSHEGIVGYLDHGQDGEVPYLVMEWLEGVTLDERLADGPIGVPETVALGRRVAFALAAVHARGIVHRDLKPSNLFLPDGRIEDARLLDFGVAHVAQSMRLTRTGAVVGTPEFMAPEQARGATDQVGAATDVFALGAVLHACLTGSSPFAAEQVVASLAKVMFAEPASLREARDDVPDALALLVQQMLAKSPEDRPKSAALIVSALEALSERPPPDAHHDRPSLGSLEDRVVAVVLGAVPAAHGAIDEADETVVDPRRRSAAVETVLAHVEAEVIQLSNGGILAVLQGPDSVRTACRAALQLRSAFGDLVVAVATGRATVGERDPSGAVIDAAARLLVDGRAGEIRIDERAAARVDGRFEIAGGRLLREAATEEARRFLGRETPFVGRTRELSMLEATYASCIEESSARAVLVIAEPGLGKSRLRHELLRRLAARDDPPLVLRAWADSTKSSSPFATIAQTVRRELALGEQAPPELAHARLADALGKERAAALARILQGAEAAAPAAPLDAQRLVERIEDAYVAWIAHLAAERPIVLVLEDLQHADHASMALVDRLLDEARDRPLLVLALGRPELRERAGDLLARRGFDELVLGPLKERAARQLLDDVLGDVDEVQAERILELAGGNAYYLEELMRAVAAGQGAAIPDSVAAMSEARVRSLPPALRRTLRAASVLGEVCWSGALAALLDEPDVDALVDELVARELVSEREPSRFEGQRELVFRHALLVETAYAMLTDGDRRLGHRLAAEWLADAGESEPATLAEHLARAGEVDRAAAELARAAARALALNDVATASAWAKRGLALQPGTEASGMLSLIAAEIARWRGDRGDQIEHAEEALEKLRAGSAPWCRAARELIQVLAWFGDADRAEQVCAALEASACETLAAEKERVAGLCVAARSLLHAGRYDAARARIVVVDALPAEVRLDPLVDAEIHRTRAAWARQHGDLMGDVDGHRAALTLYESAGLDVEALNARVSYGYALVARGDLDAGHVELARALQQADALGLAPIAARARHNLGLVALARGDLDEAARVEQAAVDFAMEQSDLRLAGGAHVYMSMIALARGDAALAEAHAREAEVCFVVLPPGRAGALAVLARALVAGDDAAAAELPSVQAMAILDELGTIEEYEPLVRLARVEVLRATGRIAAARELLAIAVACLHERAECLAPSEARLHLTNHPVNAALMSLHDALGGS